MRVKGIVDNQDAPTDAEWSNAGTWWSTSNCDFDMAGGMIGFVADSNVVLTCLPLPACGKQAGAVGRQVDNLTLKADLDAIRLGTAALHPPARPEGPAEPGRVREGPEAGPKRAKPRRGARIARPLQPP